MRACVRACLLACMYLSNYIYIHEFNPAEVGILSYLQAVYVALPRGFDGEISLMHVCMYVCSTHGMILILIFW